MDASIRDDKYQKRRKQSFSKWLLVLLGAAMLLTIYSIFGPTNRMVEQQRPKVRFVAPPKLMMTKMIEVQEMPHEKLLRQTIQDCLPLADAKCKTFVPEPTAGDMEKVQRVAMIAPPGKIALAIQNHMKIVAEEYNMGDDRQNPKIDIVETSHVPPYGYGKSHGLTRIVKVMPQPFLLQAIDAFKALLGSTKAMEQVTLQDLQVGLLQLMRFHCRLSHVAAHTASLTIDARTLVNNTQLDLSLRAFMTPDVNVPPDEDEAVDDDEMSIVSEEKSLGASVFTRLSETIPVGHDSILQILDRVMMEEMKRTKDMTIWPCPSFWDAPPPLQLSDLTRRLAASLSPDCDDPYASCFVQKDRCEAAADPVCKMKK